MKPYLAVLLVECVLKDGQRLTLTSIRLLGPPIELGTLGFKVSDFTTTQRLLPGCSLAFPVVGQVRLWFDVMCGNIRRLNWQRFNSTSCTYVC